MPFYCGLNGNIRLALQDYLRDIYGSDKHAAAGKDRRRRDAISRLPTILNILDGERPLKRSHVLDAIRILDGTKAQKSHPPLTQQHLIKLLRHSSTEAEITLRLSVLALRGFTGTVPKVEYEGEEEECVETSCVKDDGTGFFEDNPVIEG